MKCLQRDNPIVRSFRENPVYTVYINIYITQEKKLPCIQNGWKFDHFCNILEPWPKQLKIVQEVSQYQPIKVSQIHRKSIILDNEIIVHNHLCIASTWRVTNHIQSFSVLTNKAPPIYPLVRDLTVALKVQQGRYIQDTQFSLDFIAFLEEMVPHRASFSMLHFLSQTAS